MSKRTYYRHKRLFFDANNSSWSKETSSAIDTKDFGSTEESSDGKNDTFIFRCIGGETDLAIDSEVIFDILLVLIYATELIKVMYTQHAMHAWIGIDQQGVSYLHLLNSFFL